MIEIIGYFVDFNVEMNVEIGVVKYILEIIDLEIGEYFIDFDVGFLLFNVNLFEGDGFIFYIISFG